MKNNEKYLRLLYGQFCRAKGLSSNDMSRYKTNEFYDWLMSNQEVMEKYYEYLLYLGYDMNRFLEIGKGKYDSFSIKNVPVVSEFGSTMGKKDETMVIIDGKPIVINDKGISYIENTVLCTHNPYNFSSILNWADVYKSGLNNISMGIYGKISDENLEEKIGNFEKFVRMLGIESYYDSEFDNDNYYCTLQTCLSKKRKLYRSRVKCR